MNYWFFDREGKLIISSINEHIPEAFNDIKGIGIKIVSGIKYRYARIVESSGSIVLISSQTDHVKSSRIFNEKVRIFVDLIRVVSEIKDKIIDDILHNITSVHGHNIQEIHNVIPEDLMFKKFDRQIDDIKQEIVKNLQGVSSALIQIIRNNRIMKAEFDIIRLLHSTPTKPKFRKEPIHKILSSILYLYYQELNSKKIKIVHGDCIEQINLDYSLFAGSLIPIFDNFIKYTKEHSTIYITYTKRQDGFDINFTMNSLRILPEEKEKIFENSYSGMLAKSTEKNGKGLGLYHARQLLQLNNADISFLPDPEDFKSNYVDNQININFIKP